MIKAQDLIGKFEYALSEKWGYILGTAGILWTADKQASTENEMAQQYGEKWIGHMVADCSGLFVWAYRQLGGSIYHGSNTIWDRYLSAKGKLVNGQPSDGKPLRPGSAVFLLRNGDDRHHIGLYIGDGKCIEAKGTIYGVVESKITHWDEWGELKDVEYDMSVPDEEPLYLATVTADNGYPVKMRSGPGTKYDIIESVPLGTAAEVYEVLDGWSKIRACGKMGYMMSKFLKPIGQSAVALSRDDYEKITSALRDALAILERLG